MLRYKFPIAEGTLLAKARALLRKSDYEALAEFRSALRRFLRFTETGAKGFGLTPQQHALLIAVRGRRGQAWASVSDIAADLQITHHAAVGLVDRSVRSGLVRRGRDPVDRRLVRITVTARGAHVLERLSLGNRRQLSALRQALNLPFLESVQDPDQNPRGEA